MSRQRVAITGAGGQVGSALVAGLASAGEFDVVAIVRNAITARTLGLATANAEIRVGSITDAESSRAMFADCDAVVNCALAKGWPPTARRQNEAIIGNIANAPSVRLAVHFSTVAVYGLCVDPRSVNFEQPRPDNSYGVDKLRLERLATRAFSARGIRGYIVRMGHVYGPSQWVSRDVLERIGDPSFALPFGGEIPSNAVSIRTVIAAVRSMLKQEQPAGVRNLVDSPQTTWRAVYDLHSELIGQPAVRSLSESASRDLRDRYYAAGKRPLRTIARTAMTALGAVDLIGVARLAAFRHVVHGPLLLLPTAIGEAAHRAYVHRKVRSAVKRALPSAPLAPAVLCWHEVRGPRYEAVDSLEAIAAMRDDLRTWLGGMSSYRWDPAAMGLEQRTLDHPKRLGSIGR